MEEKVPPPAQEIIAAIYRQISSLRENGRKPSAIVLPVSYYRAIQQFRGSLGEVPQGLPDYLGKYDLFGIPLYTDGGDTVVIRSGKGKQ